MTWCKSKGKIISFQRSGWVCTLVVERKPQKSIHWEIGPVHQNSMIVFRTGASMKAQKLVDCHCWWVFWSTSMVTVKGQTKNIKEESMSKNVFQFARIPDTILNMWRGVLVLLLIDGYADILSILPKHFSTHVPSPFLLTSRWVWRAKIWNGSFFEVSYFVFIICVSGADKKVVSNYAFCVTYMPMTESFFRLTRGLVATMFGCLYSFLMLVNPLPACHLLNCVLWNGVSCSAALLQHIKLASDVERQGIKPNMIFVLSAHLRENSWKARRNQVPSV